MTTCKMLLVMQKVSMDGDFVKPSDFEPVQLPHLETFSKAAELCSFTGTAKALRLTQAAVSQRIQALERTLNRPLFKRQGGRVVLTEAGKKLYEIAQQILDLHRHARSVIAQQEEPATGELVLAASSVPGEHFLPALLFTFGEEHPYIRVRATVADSMAVIADVERGDVSLGLVGRRVHQAHLDFRHLANDRVVLVVPRGHPLRKRASVDVRQLAEYPLVMREAASGLRHCFEKSLERAGLSLTHFRIALELGSNEGIKEAVLRGVGVAILSLYAVQKELKSKQLHALDIDGIECDREMFIVQDTRRALSLPARIFLDFLEAHPVPELFA